MKGEITKFPNLLTDGVIGTTGGDGTVGVTVLSASTLLGRGTTGGVSNITLGTNLSMSGSILNAASPAVNWSSVAVSGADFTTTSNALVDITGLVTGTLSTATLYEFECVLYVTSSSAAGVAVGIQQSGTGSGQIGVWSGSATNAAATGMSIGSNTLNTAGAPCVLVVGDGQITIKGFIKTGTTGSPTISIKILKTTSGTAIAYIGSVLRYRVAN